MFPIIEDGKWGSINLQGEVLIQPSYDHIGVFRNGFSIAAKHEKFGIIDSSEQVIIPFSYQHIRSNFNKEFVLKKGNFFELYDANTRRIYPDKFEQISNQHKDYFHTQKNNLWGVIKDFIQIIPCNYDTIKPNYNDQIHLCDSASKVVVYNQNGFRLFSANSDGENNEGFFKNVSFKDSSLDEIITELEFFQKDLFLFKKTKQYGLINVKTDEILLNEKYDTIYPNQNWIILKRNDSVGFCDFQGKIVQELKPYEFFINSDGIWTKAKDPNNEDNTYTGFLFNNGNSIPAIFSKITYNKDYYYTSKGRRKGLYTSNGRKILSCKYDEIITNDNLVKAYKGNSMVKIVLSKSGKQLTKQEFNNAMRVTLNSYQRYANSPSPFNSNRRNYALEYKYGWYGDTIRDTAGVLKKIKLGIKFHDSTYQRPIYDKIEYMEDYNITRASNRSRNTRENSVRMSYSPHDYFNFNEGKRMNKLKLQYSSPTDWTSNFHMEVINRNGLFFMDSTGNLSEKMGFIDRQYDSLKRFITFGKGPTKKCNYAFCLYDNRIPISNRDLKNKTIAFKKGEWGYMDASGKQRFRGEFTAIENFKNGTAIVTKGAKGLIDKDSLLIPTKFHSLTRYQELGDTIFSAQLNGFKKFFTDSLLKPYQFNYHSIIKRIDDKLWIKKAANTNGILDGKLNFVEIKGIIKENYENLLLVKKRGLYGITDLNGVNLIPIKYNQIQKLNCGFSLKQKRTFGYANNEGVILLETKFSDIKFANKKYIIAKLNGLYGLYDQNGSLLLEHKYKTIHVNEVNGRILVMKNNGKSYFLSEDLQKETRINSEYQIIGSIGSYYIYLERAKIGLLDSLKEQKTGAMFSEIKSMTTAMIELRIGKKKKLFLTETNTLTKKFYRESMWVFDDIYMTKQTSSCRFYSKEGNKVFQAYSYYDVNKNENGLALIRSNKGSFFMNRNFQNEFNEYFENANSFFGNYACVASIKGWQIINRKGFRKTYPSYGYLRPLFPNVFEAKTYAAKGVFNSRGKEIVPVVYEKINLIDNSYFQAINDGAIHYYDLFGNQIY